jgi:hypothetical protein
LDKKLTERGVQKATKAIEDAFGLPPAVKTPHDNDGPPRDPNAPSGSLSSDDAEVLPVDFSTDTKPR